MHEKPIALTALVMIANDIKIPPLALFSPKDTSGMHFRSSFRKNLVQ